MRKFFILLTVLCLALVPALAEQTEVSGDMLICTFDDFTVSIPIEILSMGQVNYTNYEEGWLLFGTATDETFTKSITCTWSGAYTDFSAYDPKELAASYIDSAIEALIEDSYIVENDTLLSASLDSLNGKDAFSYTYCWEIGEDAENLEFEYSIETIISDEVVGTYTFTISISSFSDLEDIQILLDVLDSIVWNF